MVVIITGTGERVAESYNGSQSGAPGVRVNCTVCGEEIINEREVWRKDMPLCQACAGPAYYALAKPVFPNKERNLVSVHY